MSCRTKGSQIMQTNASKDTCFCLIKFKHHYTVCFSGLLNYFWPTCFLESMDLQWVQRYFSGPKEKMRERERERERESERVRESECVCVCVCVLRGPLLLFPSSFGGVCVCVLPFHERESLSLIRRLKHTLCLPCEGQTAQWNVSLFVFPFPKVVVKFLNFEMFPSFSYPRSTFILLACGK